MLLNPGPEVVICDEGHRIKNSQTNLSIVLNKIKTKRRIVLTGFDARPLQPPFTPAPAIRCRTTWASTGAWSTLCVQCTSAP